VSGADDPILQLQRDYLAELPGMLLLIRSEIDRFRQGDPGAAASLRTRFHHLAGSGESYGFPALSAVARQAEQWLRTEPSPVEAARLDAVVTRLEEIVGEMAKGLEGGDE
jgi:HPt (histidine-containing phosphotransfer) domain-containing protein